MAETIALDEHLRDPDRVAIEKNGHPKYLHKSLRPLADVLVELDRADRMQPGLFDNDPTALGTSVTGFATPNHNPWRNAYATPHPMKRTPPAIGLTRRRRSNRNAQGV